MFYHMSIPSLSSLKFIHFDMVPVSPFVGLGLLFMIMFVGVSFIVIQSGLSSDIICLVSFLALLVGSNMITFFPAVIT